MLMKNNCNVFSHKDTSFALQRDREGAARVNKFNRLHYGDSLI